MANNEATMSNMLSYSFIIILIIALLLELSYDTLELSYLKNAYLSPIDMTVS